MPRINWSHASFNWPLTTVVDGKVVNLDAKELNSPQPCSHGINCTYKNAEPCVRSSTLAKRVWVVTTSLHA